MYGLHGLGDAAFDAAKLDLESRVGIPYTGSATTADQLNAVKAIMTRIANGDRSAWIEGTSYPDPFVQKVAMDYLTRYYQSSDGNPQTASSTRSFWLSVPASLFNAVAGHAISTEPWWRYDREGQVMATLFPILGGGSGVADGYARNLAVGFQYTAQNIYEPDFDFGALAQAAQQWAAQHPVTAPTPEAITRVQQTATERVPQPSGPPAGWNFNGSDGWWGPDGKFYAGDANSTPWSSGQQGVSVETYKQTPPPPPPATSGGASAGGAEPEPTPTASTPSAPRPSAPGPLLTPGVTPYTTPPAIDYGPTPDATGTDAGTPVATAGFGGGAAWLLGLGLVGALFAMKGKRK